MDNIGDFVGALVTRIRHPRWWGLDSSATRRSGDSLGGESSEWSTRGLGV